MEGDLRTGMRRRQIPLKGIIRIATFAVDWVAQNIYVIDRLLSTLNVININTGKQTNIAGYMHMAMDIAVDPLEG